MSRTTRIVAFLLALVGLAASGCMRTSAQSSEAPSIQYIEPSAETGTSMATVAGTGPVARTTQLLPLDAEGQLVGAGDADAQIDRVLQNLRRALAEAGAELEDLLKVNVYAARTEVVQHVQDRFAQQFAGEAKPAISFVVTDLPQPEALVAIDAVAMAAPTEAPRRRVVYHADALGGDAERGHVAVMPPGGGRVYISGQVAEGQPVEALRASLESLHDRLAYLGLSADDVVQVKVFMDDMANADTLAAKIAEYYRKKPAPPLVMVEWTHPGADVEVELIAARGSVEASSAADSSAGEGAVTYPLPPGLKTFPTYSRAAEIHHGRVVYVSGLYGDPAKEAEGQMRDIFAWLGQVIEQAGSDFDHLAKATYYLNSWEIKSPLWGIRKEFYDPERPPTSSLIPVKGVGKEGALVTIDMVGVVPE